MGYKLETVTLRHLWPKAPQEKIDSICEISAQVFDQYGIGDDARVVAQLMANISHECGAGTIVRESGKYRAARIVAVFGAPRSSAAVTAQEARYLAGDEKALFERVYNLPRSPKLARELGNSQPGDGYKFRGGGDLQLTGRDSYQRIGRLTGHPEIAENPDLLADPKVSFTVAVAEFAALGCIAPARKGNTTLVRRKVNGGTNGLSEVQVWVRKWETALPEIEDPPLAPRGSDSGETKLTDSTVIKGSIGTAVATGAGLVSQISGVTQQASDTVLQVQGASANVTTVVKAVHPVLGLMPQVWTGIGIAGCVVALICIGYIAYQQWQKHRSGMAEG